MVHVRVCMYAAIFQSLLILKALTDPHQSCCEGQTTKCCEVDGGGEAAPALWAAQPTAKGRQALPPVAATNRVPTDILKSEILTFPDLS